MTKAEIALNILLKVLDDQDANKDPKLTERIENSNGDLDGYYYLPKKLAEFYNTILENLNIKDSDLRKGLKIQKT